MRRLLALVASIVFCLALLPAAQAEEEKKAEPKAPEAKAEKKAAPSEAAEESEEIIFERLTGFYFEGRGGIFFTVGGARGYSNGQPFFGFEFGYDITDRFSIQFGYASGFQAANPIEYPDTAGDPGYHWDFGLTFFNLSADYDLVSRKRFALEARLGGGITIIHPSAIPDQGAVDGDFFGGIRFEYYTLLKHFTLGAEYDFYFVIPTKIPAMSISMSVIYNF